MSLLQVDLDLLQMLFLELLAALEQLLVHFCQTCQLDFHLFSSLSEFTLPALLPLVKLNGHLFQSPMHFLHSYLILLKDIDSLLVFGL